MSEHLKLSPHRLVIERVLDDSPPDTETRFLGDPARWLPGRRTMHGATTFHERMRLLGVPVTVEFVVGASWTRGATDARRLRVTFVEPPVVIAWMLPAVDGDLVLTPDHDDSLALRFEGAATTPGFLHGRRLLAPYVMRAIVDGIASRLSADASPSHG